MTLLLLDRTELELVGHFSVRLVTLFVCDFVILVCFIQTNKLYTYISQLWLCRYGDVFAGMFVATVAKSVF